MEENSEFLPHKSGAKKEVLFTDVSCIFLRLKYVFSIMVK